MMIKVSLKIMYVDTLTRGTGTTIIYKMQVWPVSIYTSISRVFDRLSLRRFYIEIIHTFWLYNCSGSMHRATTSQALPNVPGTLGLDVMVGDRPATRILHMAGPLNKYISPIITTLKHYIVLEMVLTSAPKCSFARCTVKANTHMYTKKDGLSNELSPPSDLFCSLFPFCLSADWTSGLTSAKSACLSNTGMNRINRPTEAIVRNNIERTITFVHTQWQRQRAQYSALNPLFMRQADGLDEITTCDTTVQ
jgi:hypothetical protein